MEMSAYCKAYAVEELRAFPRWTENLANPDHDPKAEERESGSPPADYYFLHDNFVVTDGIFRDENVIFSEVSPEWKLFCAEVLKFQAPEPDPLAAGSQG